MYFFIYLFGLIATFVGLKVYKELNPRYFEDGHEDCDLLCPSIMWPVLLPLFLILWGIDSLCYALDSSLGAYIRMRREDKNVESQRTEE